jgi:hypothetical protein
VKRWLIRIVVCLIVGAVTTVAVAWACVITSPGNIESLSLEDGERLLAWAESVGFTWSAQRDNDYPVYSEWTGWGLSRRSVHPYTTFESRWGASGISAGIPAHAVKAHVVCSYGSPEWSSVGGFSIDSPGIGAEVLPWSPIWPGFLIDTLFYAAIWFGVFFGFASAKQAIRRKRGRCPRCGYDLRGALETGCPECGWGR